MKHTPKVLRVKEIIFAVFCT